MRLLVIEHQADAGAGVFGDVLGRQAELELWHPATERPPRLDGIGAILVLGGGMHPDQTSEHPWLEDERALLSDALAREVPTLGICLGAELLAQAQGGAVRRAARPEIGWSEVELTEDGHEDPLLGGLPPRFCAFAWHSFVIEPPPRTVILAGNSTGIQAIRLNRRAWGLQFHAEVNEAIALGWVEDYEADEDAVAIGIDPAQLASETRARIAGWNRIGESIAARFLSLVASGSP